MTRQEFNYLSRTLERLQTHLHFNMSGNPCLSNPPNFLSLFIFSLSTSFFNVIYYFFYRALSIRYEIQQDMNSTCQSYHGYIYNSTAWQNPCFFPPSEMPFHIFCFNLTHVFLEHFSFSICYQIRQEVMSLFQLSVLLEHLGRGGGRED